MKCAEPKTRQGGLPTCSRLYPLYKTEGHGAHWRPVMEDAYFSYLKKDPPIQAVVITRHVFPEQQYKREAERYIEIIQMLRQLPGGSEVCDDIFSKIPVTTEETVTVN